MGRGVCVGRRSHCKSAKEKDGGAWVEFNATRACRRESTTPTKLWVREQSSVLGQRLNPIRIYMKKALPPLCPLKDAGGTAMMDTSMTTLLRPSTVFLGSTWEEGNKNCETGYSNASQKS